MNVEDWRRANELFERVLDLSPAERQDVLDVTCQDEPELRAAVERRLRADAAAEAGSFLAQPIVSRPSTGADVRSARGTSPPERLGPYRILHQIGQGGMGTVYAAERDDDAFHRQVAIKVITSGTENLEVVRRMESERRILALLEHPNIARIYDAGTTEDGLPYFVMEHVAGVPIDQYCATQRSSIEERVDLIRKVCSAVDYANRNLVVHRDLKPSNILITAEGEPKLLDFGIAKFLAPTPGPAAGGPPTDEPESTDSPDDPAVPGNAVPGDAASGDAASGNAAPGNAAPGDATAPWRRRLTLNSASPEQVRGETISTASDVYSLGVLLFQLLTGSLPRSLDGLSPQEAEQRLTTTEPLRPSTRVVEGEETPAAPPGPPRQVSRRLRGDLDSIVLEALRSEVGARYPSAAHLAEDLERYRRGLPVLAHRGSLGYRTGKLLRRYRLTTTLVAIALVLAAAFVGSRVVAANNLARSQARLLEERAKLELVLEVLLGIFEDAGPYASGGVDLTVRQAVDRQAARFDEELEAQPEVQAVVLSALGWIYLDLGVRDKALGYHQRALTLRRSLDEGSVEVAESLDGVAASLRDQWQFDRAAELSAAALDLYREQTTIEPEELLRCLNNRVTLFCLLGDWQAADPLSSEALRLSREVGPKDPEASKALIQRAHVLKQLGDLAGARELYLQAEGNYTRRFGPNHPILATLYNNLGRLAADDEHFEAAAEYWRRADAQYVTAFGDDFYERVRPLTNIGKHLHRTGDFEGAEAALRTALEVAVRSPALGPEYEAEYYGRPAIELGKLLAKTGRCSEVVSLLEEKVAKWEKDSKGPVVEQGNALLKQCREDS